MATIPTIEIEPTSGSGDYTLSLWLKDVIPHTPGATRTVVRAELVNVIRDFFTRSMCWRGVSRLTDAKADKREYYLSPRDAYSNVVAVHQVEFYGQPLVKLPRKPAYSTTSANVPAGYYLGERPDVVNLVPVPNVLQEKALQFFVSLTPNTNVKRVPSIAVTHYFEAIKHGLLTRLYSHPSKPYSNVLLAQFHAQRYAIAVAEARGLGKQGYNNSQDWAFPSFA